MKRLPLYSDAPRVLDGHPDQLPDRSACRTCDGVRGGPCAADGSAGGLLVLGGGPAPDDMGRPFWSRGARRLRKDIERHWSGPVAYDNAWRCQAKKDLKPKEQKALTENCRVHTVDILRAVKPERILVTHDEAAISLYGPTSYPGTRRASRWLKFEGRWIPVFFLPSQLGVHGNKHLTKRWNADLRWALTEDAPEGPWAAHTDVVQTLADAEKAAADIRDAGCMVFDIENYGDAYEEAFTVLCLSAGRADSDHTYTWATRDKSCPTLGPLLGLLEDPNVAKLAHFGKHDVTGVERYFRITVRGKFLDSGLLHRMVDNTQPAALEACAEQVGCGGHKNEFYQHVAAAKKLISSHRTRQNRKTKKRPKPITTGGYMACYQDAMHHPSIAPRHDAHMLAHAIANRHKETAAYAYAFAPRDTLHRYCALDVVATARVWRHQWAQLRELPDVKLAWDELVQPATRTMSRVEQNGIYVDVPALDALRTFLDIREMEISAQIDLHVSKYAQHFPHGINLTAPLEVADLLFKHIGLPVLKRTAKTGAPSTSKDVLAKLKDKHPVVGLILEHKTVTKLQGTYGDGMAPHVKNDNRIHATFNITGTGTGRMSCSEPNCFSGDTEVLTPDGWVRFDRMNRAALPRVAQWHPGGEITWARPTGWVSHEAPLVHLHNTNTDLAVTADHRCLLQHRKTGDLRVFPAAKYPDDWQQLHTGFLGGRISLTAVQLALLCAVQADAHKTKAGALDWQFKRQRKADRLRWALQALGIPYRESTPKKGGFRFYVARASIPSFVGEYLDDERNFCWSLLGLDAASRMRFVSEVHLWDGCSTRESQYSSKRAQNVDIVQAILCTSGRRTRRRRYKDRLWVLDTSSAGRGHSMTTNISRDALPAQRVYCVSVPSTYLLVRRNGRVSVTGNCQTIPSRGEYAKMVKNVFGAPPGRKLVQWDYSQLELRVAAMLSEDPVMLAIYNELRDYHDETAAIIAPTAWGVTFEKPTEELKAKDPARHQLMDDIRRAAKAVNFGLLYGMGDDTLAEEANVTVVQAKKIRAAIFGKMKVLKRWIDQCVRTVRRDGFSSTKWLGKDARRRYLWDASLEGKSAWASERRSNATNAAYNTPVQGTASDYCMASLHAIQQYLDDEGLDAKIVMTVHDSILLEVADHDLDEVVPEVTRIMESWPSGKVPLKVDCELGQSWGAMVKWDTWQQQREAACSI